LEEEENDSSGPSFAGIIMKKYKKEMD